MLGDGSGIIWGGIIILRSVMKMSRWLRSYVIYMIR